jgi:tRNA(Arg) A34 adenosine deaminase TadA
MGIVTLPARGVKGAARRRYTVVDQAKGLFYTTGNVCLEEGTGVMSDIEIMKSLIAYTHERALENRTFTGAYIVKNGEIIQKSITSIEPDKNPLAHAELKAIQAAIANHGPELKGCHLFTTQQPCPMCASAIVWSGIEKVVFGFAPSDCQWKTFDNIHRFLADLNVECVGPFLESECKAIDDYLIAHGI